MTFVCFLTNCLCRPLLLLLLFALLSITNFLLLYSIIVKRKLIEKKKIGAKAIIDCLTINCVYEDGAPDMRHIIWEWVLVFGAGSHASLLDIWWEQMIDNTLKSIDNLLKLWFCEREALTRGSCAVYKILNICNKTIDKIMQLFIV